MKPADFIELIKVRHKAKIKRPLFVEASPGVGKTEIVGQVARELNIGFMVNHGPLLQPEDCGIPVISKDRTDLTFLVPAEKFPLVGSDCPDEGILLFDDMSQADNAIQKMLGNLFQEREIHGKKIKKGWMLIGTGNRAKDRAGASRILGHLGNKLSRVELEVNTDNWTQWAIENEVKTEIISFIRFRPDLLNNYSPTQDVNATPRAWVHGVNAQLGVIPSHLEFEAFKGDVGEGPAVEFLAFLKIYRNLPSPDAIFLDPKKAKVPTDPATIYALCGALAHKSTPANFDRALTYIRRLEPEFSVMFMRDAVGRNEDLATTKTYIDWASKEGTDLLA